MRALLHEREREHAKAIAQRDEMIQTLLDRIQAPERVPIWREPSPAPMEELILPPDPWALVPDPDQLP